MQYQLRIFLFVVTLLGLTHCQRLSLIGSHFIPIESNYTAFLSAHNLEPGSSVNVTLNNKQYSKSIYIDSFDDNSVVPVELELPQQRSADYTLKIQTNSNNKCMYQSVKVINLKQYPITFIYLDKPIYKPGDVLTFQIFILGQDLLPYPEILKVDVQFFDSNGDSVHNITDIKTTTFGFSEKTFTIPETHNYGDWKIEVQANNRRKSKDFIVQPQNEANFDVFLNMLDNIAFEDQKCIMTLFTRPENDQVFDGSAKISMKAKTWGSNHYEINKFVKTVNLLGNKNQILLKMYEDLGISSPVDDMDLIFDIDVTDNSSKNVINVKKEVRMIQGRSNIQVIRKKYFKPGFKFPIKVRVKIMNGQIDNSLNQLKITIEYKTENGATKTKKDLEVNLKNGEMSTILTPAADIDKIRISLEFGGSTLVEIIPKFSTYGINEFMQVSFIEKSTKVGDIIQLQAQSNEEFETLNLMVFGTNGLIHNEEFPDAVGKDSYNFKIELTEQMKPEIRGLVYYIRPSDGVMVYDEFLLSLGFSIDNSLEISAPKYAKPNEQIDITVKSEQGSLVLLTGIDKNSELFNYENEISRSDVYSELTYYLNFSVQNLHEYKFEKVNNYVLEPFQKGAICGKKQTKISPIPESNDVKAWNQKYFPSTWFSKPIKMNSGTESVRLTVPNKVKNWRIYGVSVHPEKGFTVAKAQPEIIVRGDFAINIKAPSIVKENEVFKVDVSAFNFIAGYLQPPVQIEVIYGNFANVWTQEDSGRTCYYFQENYQSSLEMSMLLNPERLTDIGNFYVRSSWNGELQIKATSWLNGVKYESEKKIKVNRIEHESTNGFEIRTKVNPFSYNEAMITVDAKIESDAYPRSDLIMEVELPSGYKYVSHESADHIKTVKLGSNQNSVEIHFNRMNSYTNYMSSIKASRVFNVYEQKKSTIRIYDANKPGQESVFSYFYDVNIQTCKEVAEAKKCNINSWKNFKQCF